MNKRHWPWPFNWFFLCVFFFYLFHLSIVCGLLNNSVIANNRIVFSQIIHTIFDKMNLYKKTVILQMFCQIQTKMFWHSVKQSAHKIKKNTDTYEILWNFTHWFAGYLKTNWHTTTTTITTTTVAPPNNTRFANGSLNYIWYVFFSLSLSCSRRPK